ncbi:MAG: DUF1330 domain-containing protein [bacterium]|nr:DUF1330 domain-containing protein [bacterium]
MTQNHQPVYLEPTQAAGAAFFSNPPQGPLVMLNLLRFKEVADYSAHPQIAPEQPISGAEAFQRYIDFTLPFLHASGGAIEFLGRGGNFLIGPAEETWDLVMLIRQASAQEFLAFASNPEYLVGLGHRSAALEDSRLLPTQAIRRLVSRSADSFTPLPFSPGDGRSDAST